MSKDGYCILDKYKMNIMYNILRRRHLFIQYVILNDEIFILSIRKSNISIDFPIILKSQDIPSKMLYWQTNTWHLTQYLNVSLLITWFFWSITFIPINTLCSTFRTLEKIAVHRPLGADSTALSTSGTYSLILFEI